VQSVYGACRRYCPQHCKYVLMDPLLQTASTVHSSARRLTARLRAASSLLRDHGVKMSNHMVTSICYMIRQIHAKAHLRQVQALQRIIFSSAKHQPIHRYRWRRTKVPVVSLSWWLGPVHVSPFSRPTAMDQRLSNRMCFINRLPWSLLALNLSKQPPR